MATQASLLARTLLARRLHEVGLQNLARVNPVPTGSGIRWVDHGEGAGISHRRLICCK